MRARWWNQPELFGVLVVLALLTVAVKLPVIKAIAFKQNMPTRTTVLKKNTAIANSTRATTDSVVCDLEPSAYGMAVAPVFWERGTRVPVAVCNTEKARADSMRKARWRDTQHGKK